MKNQDPEKLGIKKLGDVRRKAINLSQEGLVKVGALFPAKPLPLLIEPAVDGVNLITWAASNLGFIETHLLRHGAILFRNFEVKSVAELEQFIMSFSLKLVVEHERSSPRSQVRGSIYTSTDHPDNQSIFLHNELSYSHTWPMKIWFFCVTAPSQGGETPIADIREVFNLIDPEIRMRFIQKKVMYVRNYGDGFGLSWQTSFQATDQSVVEAYCRSAGIECEWKDDNHLRTRRVGLAVARHPKTGDMVWFNHAAFFHVSTLEPMIRDALLTEFKEEDLPTNSYYGDGSPIEDRVLDEIREAYRQATVRFSWRPGDILMLDNMLVAHGRTPFVGPRKVVVAMAEPISDQGMSVEP